jgi:LPS export ABC transporter protein LptC
MPTWQRRARLLIAIAAIAFAIVVAIAFKGRNPPSAAAPAIPPADPEAVVESATGTTVRINREQEEVRIEYDKLLTYPNGATKMVGMKVTTVRDNGRTFVLTGNEGEIQQDPSSFEIAGDVELTSSDGLRVRGREATYSEKDGIVRAPGPVEFSEGRISGNSTGLTYDKNQDALTLLDDAVVKVAPDESGADGIAVYSDLADFRRTARTIRFEGGMKAAQETQDIEADTAIVQLGGGQNEERLERLELRGHSRITASKPVAGGLQSLAGDDIDLAYAEDGRKLQQASIRDNASIVLGGEAGSAGRRVGADEIEVTLAEDGATPTELHARRTVSIVLPAPKGGPTRTVTADTFDALGKEGRGLTEGRFRGDVLFRERGKGLEREARSTQLDTVAAPGLGELETARFSGAVRFVDGTMTADAERALYGVSNNTLELRKADNSDRLPRMVSDRLTIEAEQIDAGLSGPRIKATGRVKSELTPSRDPAVAEKTKPTPTRRVPSMLRNDQPVIVVSDNLTYDGAASTAAYDGNARLSQGDTSIRATSISLDERSGDLKATGGVVTTTILEQTTGGKRERVPSIARAQHFVYEEGTRKATYTGGAQVGGPPGEMHAARIELYLRPSGNELDRVEAYDDVALMEQRRKTTGVRLTYFGEDDRYVVIGTPVRILDECGRETTGRTLTFYRNTDRIVVDGNEQIRTRTTGTSTCS